MRERYGDKCPNWTLVRFRDSRQMADGALHISVHDVIVAIKGYSQQNAAQEFKRRGVGALGVPPKWLTEVADSNTIYSFQGLLKASKCFQNLPGGFQGLPKASRSF